MRTREGKTLPLKVLAIACATAIVSGCLESSDPGLADPGSGDLDPGATNRPPSISGSPASAVMIGENYSFTPSASDPEGDSLTFSITNKPRWASFNSTNGRLTGRVSLGDVAIYEKIRITVSDGTNRTSLPEFSINVTNSALGSMTLHWVAPTENSDGTPLVDLSGYNIYYGTRRGTYPNQVHIGNPSINTYVIENLVPDTYYVVATSFNSSGVESTYSNVAVRTVSLN